MPESDSQGDVSCSHDSEEVSRDLGTQKQRSAQKQEQEQKKKRKASLDGWGRSGTFPVAPPALGELHQQSVDF